MVFSSITFVSVFLPLVFLLHWILPDIRVKNALLIAASLLFYAYGEPMYVLLMTGSVWINYLLGMACGDRTDHRENDGQDGEKLLRKETEQMQKRGRLVLILAVIWNIGILILFKYTGFLAQLINQTGVVTLPVPQIELPIGISFFTFQAMSYVIDVYRGSVRPQRSFCKVLLYISFFPQLIAGPIVKYHDMEREIDERKVTLEGTAYGMRRFAAGLSKKVLISNVLGLTADTLFAADPGSINVCTAWIAALSYLFQIYFDFSGYSDMALGMGEMFGFHFKENFNYPYSSGSVQEFWRRWHMSLSGWFREYLYIPLGGNRKGHLRTVMNKFAVFFCTGLWHGANITFVVWGLFHGLFLMLEEYLPVWLERTGIRKTDCPENGRNESGQEAGSRMQKVQTGISVLKHAYTLLVVTVGFVIFRAETMAQGLYFIKEMFIGFHFETEAMSLALQQLTPLYLTVFAAAVAASCPVKAWMEKQKGYEAVSWIASMAGLVLCILSLSGSTYNPFIYFRF